MQSTVSIRIKNDMRTYSFDTNFPLPSPPHIFHYLQSLWAVRTIPDCSVKETIKKY